MNPARRYYIGRLLGLSKRLLAITEDNIVRDSKVQSLIANVLLQQLLGELIGLVIIVLNIVQ